MAIQEYRYRWTYGCALDWQFRTNWFATLLLIGWVVAWVSVSCWIGIHFLALLAVVIVALWFIVIFLVIVVLLLGLAIHPKSLVDFARWTINLAPRYLRILWNFPRSEWISLNREWFSHGFYWPSYSLLHAGVRRAWWNGRGPGFYRSHSILRNEISNITIESHDMYQIVQVHHGHGIEELGFDLPASEQALLCDFLLSWLADGTLTEFRATPLTRCV